MPVQTQIQVRRGTASSWTSTNPTLAAGEIGFETDTGKIKVGTGSSTWSALNYVGAANAIQYVYTATAGQTTFSGADNNALTLSYTVGAEQVYVNGVLQVRGTDYTATNGTSVVLTTATIASDIVTVIAYGTFTVADTYTQAQANATFPLNTSAFFAGKNKIINGDFGVWQRGTSFSTSGSLSYTADRFLAYMDGNGTATTSQQTFTPGTAPVSGYEGTYFLRQAVTTKGTSTYIQWEQRIEDVRQFAGQTITVSFWARVNSGTVSPMNVQFFQAFGTGGSSAVYTSASTATLTSSWARYSFTFSIPSVSGKTIGTGSYLGLDVWLPFSTTTSVDYWGVQLEAGSVATAFQTATGTIQGELAACQRYYIRLNADTNYTYFATGSAQNSNTLFVSTSLPVPLRVTPASIDIPALSNFFAEQSGSVSVTSLTAITLGSGGPSKNTLMLQVDKTSGFTSGSFYRLLANNSTSAYIGVSAEL